LNGAVRTPMQRYRCAATSVHRGCNVKTTDDATASGLDHRPPTQNRGPPFCPRQPRPRNFSHPSALDHRRPPSIFTIQLGRLRETSASRRPELKAGLLFAAARNEKRRLGPPVLGGVFV
jgi:hypothetical protein